MATNDECVHADCDRMDRGAELCVDCPHRNNETVADILKVLDAMPAKMEGHNSEGELLVLDMKALKSRIEAAVKREMDEAAKAIAKLAEGICAHCDMQGDCAEGEDGMATMCNAMSNVRKFIEEHKIEEKKNGLPF